MDDLPWSFGEKCDLAERLAKDGRPEDYIIEHTGLLPVTVKGIVSRVRFELDFECLRRNVKED